MTTPRRTALDPVRLDYRKRVMTPAGNEMVVRARRKIDADSVDPIAVPLPLAIVAIWVAVRERRNHKQYQHQWVVDVFPRYEFEKARVIAEVPKYEALDLVDAHASELEAAEAQTHSHAQMVKRGVAEAPDGPTLTAGTTFSTWDRRES